MRGKKVIDREEYIDKIRAADSARDGRDFIIVSRTDALAAVSLDEAIARMIEARAAGADASFVEAPISLDQMAEIGKRAPKPIVANMIEKGKTPVLSKQQLEQLGFNLIVYPLCGIFAAARALEEIYKKLLRDQSTTGMGDRMMSFDEFNELIGVERKYALGEKFGVRD
jgi:methylisocitrate lyase